MAIPPMIFILLAHPVWTRCGSHHVYLVGAALFFLRFELPLLSLPIGDVCCSRFCDHGAPWAAMMRPIRGSWSVDLA
jgi:hypothetical protein